MMRLVLGLGVVIGLFGTMAACKKDEPSASPAPPPVKAPPPAAAEPPKAPADPAVLARGEYLVTVVMNCAACHTPIGPTGPDLSKLFAGGLEITESFGTWRSPNITQDRKTGIGDWTDAQIAAAIREGKRPSGDLMYPIMPYPFYNALSDDDIKAVVAFLRTIPAIEHAPKGSDELKLPKAPVPKPTGAAPAADPIAQGAYYATLAHCSQCHTPMGPQGPELSKAMAGGQVFTLPQMGTGEFVASNVTPDPATGIGKWTDEQVAAAITKLTRPDGKPIMGPMALLGMNWGRLEPAHVAGMVAWLRALPPVVNKLPASTFVPHPPPPGAEAAPPAPPAPPTK